MNPWHKKVSFVSQLLGNLSGSGTGCGYKRWIPNPGEGYYYVGAGGTISYTRAGSINDAWYGNLDECLAYRISVGNVHRKKKHALLYRQNLKRLYANMLPLGKL